MSDPRAGQVAEPDLAAPAEAAIPTPDVDHEVDRDVAVGRPSETPDSAVVPAPTAETEAPAGPEPTAEPAPTAEPEVEAAPSDVVVPESQTAQFSRALISAVSVDLPNQHPTVVLREIESPRRQLSFSIGMADAVVLSHAMRRIPTPRPMTHELLSGILQGFNIDVVAVRMVGRQGSIYFGELDLQGRNGRSVLSCRPSDGLTVALLQPVPVPILIDERLLELDGDVSPD